MWTDGVDLVHHGLKPRKNSSQDNAAKSHHRAEVITQREQVLSCVGTSSDHDFGNFDFALAASNLFAIDLDLLLGWRHRELKLLTDGILHVGSVDSDLSHVGSPNSK